MHLAAAEAFECFFSSYEKQGSEISVKNEDFPPRGRRSRKKTKNKTKEEEPCGKLLKKTPALKNPVFKPAESSAFQIAALNAKWSTIFKM